MISGAVWYLDKWSKHKYGGQATWAMTAPGSNREYDMMPAALIYGLFTAGIPAVHIAAMPYAKIADLSYDLAEYASRTDSIWRSQIPKFFTRKGMLRVGAKIGARALPVVGWALLAYDVYNVSKWYLETDF